MNAWPRRPRRGSDDEAERLVAELRGIPPQHATASTVEGYAMATQLLRDRIGSPLWFEAVIALGSHLLENPDGDRGDNLLGALAWYDVAMKAAEELGDERQWTVAASGFANTVVTDPRSDQEALADAIGMLERVADTFRTRDWADVGQLATCLSQLATAHTKVQDDPIGQHEEAIRIRQEAVRLLAEAGPGAAALLSRARHNLAGLLDQRRVGMRSQNVDRAVRLLEAALQDRPATTDPVGRARTLRALALLYPEWSFADSLAHAERLADLAAEEARELDQGGEAVAARGQGWAFLERQRSALDVDLDHLYRRDRAQAIGWLNDCIENHSAALGVLEPDTMPLRWAEWMGGLGRLLGRGPSFGEWQYVDDAQDCFARALEAFNPEDHPGLALLLLERWGELCHEIGDFPGSLAAHRRAYDLSDRVLRSTTDPDHRLVEIEEARGFALFAAYAAARAGSPEEAVAFAERQRMRLQGDLLGAREVLAGPEPARSEMLEALAQVQRLERELEALDEQDPDVELERWRATLADEGGVDPSLIQMRRAGPGADDPNPVADERSRLGAELRTAGARVQQLLPPDSAEPARGAEASEVAEALGSAVVYLLATVHGGAALAALPDGSCDVLLLDDLTSDVTRELVHGGQATVGFVQAAVQGQRAALAGCLDGIASTLGPALFAPLTRWLVERGLFRAVLVPIGSVGLLPLHVAAGTEVLYSQAPSARVLRAGGGPGAAAGLLLVGDPERDGRARLPFAVVEARALERLISDEPATVLIGPQATRSAVLATPVPARLVHFGCHGRFRPSDPLASELLLAGDDRITVGDLFAGRVDLSGAELVAVLACRSGNVEFRRTPDEALSFPGALLVAGVPSVVSTMWPAEDSASALFAVRLYALLHEDGLVPAEAVSRARLWLRDATAAELLDLVARLRADLAPEDRTADQALAELTASLRLHRPDDAPYSGPELWAPFVHTGPV